MKLAKVIMIIAMTGLIAVLWLVFFREQRIAVEPQYMQGTRNLNQRPAASGNRGDDPTYAEELRANTAVMEATRSRQENLVKDLERVREENEREKKALKKQIADMQQEMQRIIENSQTALGDAASQGAEAVRKEVASLTDKMAKQVGALQKSLEEKQKQNEAKMRELESAVKAAREQNNIVADVTIQDSAPQPEQKMRRSVYASAGMTLPYTSQRTPQQVKEQETDMLHAIEQVAQQMSGQFGGSASGGLGTSGQSGRASTISRDGRASGPLPQAQTNQKPTKWETVFPVYTLPSNTILSGSRLLTPLIGRVPIGRNTVSDPYFFRVEVGSENLAANGHNIPGVAKMIVSGYAVGVREQECARGYIDTLTFIFRDGRIVEHGKPSKSGTSNSTALGWLSDPWGKPCIGGRYIDNASDYMKSRGAAAFVEAAAAGLSQGQMSYRQNNDGNVIAILDGNVWRYVLGQGISGTAAEYAAYVRERTSSAYDVVYVEQGTPVQIMLDTQIPIDYDAKARRVNYYREPERRHSYD